MHIVQKGKCLGLVLCLDIIFLASPLVAGDAEQFDRVVKAIVAALPVGWTIVDQKSGEIPYGHHWGENYTGPTGVLVIAKGTRPVHAGCIAANGTSPVVHVATESLEIWLMPESYGDSFWSKFNISRPVQPTTVVAHGPVKVYARPSHLLLSEKHFNDLLSNTNGVRWVDCPFDSPRLLTWKDWRAKLRKAIEKELTK
jgi:hypothetical protein